MQGGFSFCGTDIADLGLEYVPDNANTYVFAGSDYKVHEQAFDGHNGGYYFGATAGIKVFHLRCIYQDNHINNGILTKIENFFQNGKTGRLVFKTRPWVYYVATVTNLDIKSITNYMNGFVNIQMKAYYPYGRCEYVFYPDDCDHETNIKANSNMLPSSMAAKTSIIKEGELLTQQTEVPLFNGGTRNAAVAIEVAGDIGDGLIISNVSTGQKMSLVGLTKKITSNSGRYLVCDSLCGRTVLTDGATAEDAHFYHDYGYINLEPNQVLHRDISISAPEEYPGYVEIYEPEKMFSDELIGNYIFLDNQWSQIIGWGRSGGRNQIVVHPSVTQASQRQSTIVSMNRIVVSPISTMA